MEPTNLTMPMVNQDRRIIDTFSKAYDEYCTPYEIMDFSADVRKVATMNRQIKLPPCKTIFIGDVSVGKTTIVNRFCFDKFPSNYKATIGVDFEVEHFKILGQNYSLQIWDTAGQERFKCIAQAYYRNANIIVVVFDMTKEESLQTTPTWLESALVVNSIQKPFIFLVGTKSDLLTKEELSAMERLSYDIARGMKAEYWSVSARTGFNIIEFFQRITSLSFEFMMRRSILELNYLPKANFNERIKVGFLQEISHGFECNANGEKSEKGKCICCVC